MKRVRIRWRIAAGKTIVGGVSVSLLAASLAFAQQPKPAAPTAAASTTGTVPAKTTDTSATAAARDYSKGFKKFYELGLPDVSGATYVKANLFGGSMDSSMHTIYELNLSGNAWLLSEDKTNGRAMLVIGGLRIVEVYDQKMLQKEAEARMKAEREKNKGKPGAPMQYWNPYGSTDGRIGAQWKQADIAKDIEKTVAYLNKAKDSKSRRHSSLTYSGSMGKLLISAIHFHKKGYTNEANNIAALLFQVSEDQRKVVMQGLNQLASDQYTDACDRFFKTGDWKRYASAIDSLVANFSTGWPQAEALKQIGERVKSRISQAEPPAIGGEGVTDEDKKLARELATSSEATNMLANPYRSFANMNGLWLLPRPKAANRVFAGQSDQPTNLLTRLTARGMKSVPVLMAMLKDDYLTMTDMATLKGGGFSRFDMSEMLDMMQEEQREMILQQMLDQTRRPASRSDIAKHLLSPLLPGHEQRRHESDHKTDPDELHSEIKAWYDEHKNKTPAELARFYMAEGDSSQKQQAFQYLLRSGTDADMAAVETYMLESEHIEYQIGTAQQYAMKRGEKAKAFIDKFIVAARAALDSRDDSGGRNEEYRKQQEKQIDSLKDLLSGKSLDQVIADIERESKPWDQSYAIIQQALSGRSFDDVITALLSATLKAKDIVTAQGLLSLTAMAPHTAMMMNEDVDEDAVNPLEAAKKRDISKHAELWKKVLADTRTAGEDMPVATSRSTRYTIGDTAAYMIERLYGAEDDPMAAQSMHRATGVLGSKAATAIVRRRAEARLAGKAGTDLPAYPSADNITGEERKQLVARLIGATAATLPSMIAGLSADEKLALAEENAKNDKLNANLAAYANRISEVNGKTAQAAAMKALEAFKDKPMTRAAAEQALTLARLIVSNDMVATCSFTRQPALGGMEITVSEMSPTNVMARNMYGMTRRGSQNQRPKVNGSVSAGEIRGNAFWNVDSDVPESGKPGATAKTESDDDLLDEAMNIAGSEMDERAVEARTEFWKAVEQLCAGEGNVCQQAAVRFNGMPKIPEIKADEKNLKSVEVNR